MTRVLSRNFDVISQKPIVARYEGGRSVAEFEMFFQAQKQKRKDAVASGTVESVDIQADGMQLDTSLEQVRTKLRI